MHDTGPLLICAPNFRPAHKSQRLYRADAVVNPTASDRDVLASLDIALVFDLRSAAERARVPGAIWTETGASVRPIDMLASLEGGSDPWSAFKARPDLHGADAAMRALYAGFPAALLSQLRPIADAIAVSEGAVLVHCTAGKDRTGFVIAILLAARGVPMAEVMTDYLASLGRYNAEAREATRQLVTSRFGTAIEDDVLDRLMTVEEAYLGASFQRIEEQFGGVSEYLAAAGIDQSHLAALEPFLLG